ncbi:MAG: hypothetical protein NVS1B10_05210 [Candidatus Saccharimonadales bacterium]
MVGADVIGFHTPSYAENFLESCKDNKITVIGKNEILVDDRSIRVADFPMGIDYAKYAAATKSKAVRKAVMRFKKKYKRNKLIVAVDRLDPTKGLVERLKAYRTLLERNPSLLKKVVFVMVAAPSRTDIDVYKRLAVRIGELVQSINDEFGTSKWTPVDYINTAQSFEEVTALFQIADVAFIAPLKDGMNLAAKEFVASKHKNGVLILSETAGAAEELKDALLVNPKKPETLVLALEQSLIMSRRELRGRLKRMQRQLSGHTVQKWANDFVSTLHKPLPVRPLITQTIKGKIELGLLNEYRHAKKRLLLLDYDGSLVPLADNYKNAHPPEKLIDLLEILCANKANDVVLISGRSSTDLEKWFGSLPINLIAEHGAAYKKSIYKSWRSTLDTDDDWKQILRPFFDKYAALARGASVEEKPHSLVWHYRVAPPYYAHKYAVILRRVIKPYLRKYGLEIMQGNQIIEIKNPRVGKGKAAKAWLAGNYQFVLAMGDDVTDEDLFKVLPIDAYSVKVGRGRTSAQYRLSSSKKTINLLKKLV